MGKEKIKNKNGTLLITNKLGKFERLNQEELKVLTNYTVPGLAPVEAIPKGRKIILQVTASNWYPMSAYMNAPMDADTVLSFIWNTLRIAYDSERYGLSLDNLCWDAGHVFVDSQKKTLNMVYWPVTTLEQKKTNALTFYYEMCGLLSRSGMDASIVDTYSSYFYQRSYFDFQTFYRMVQDVLDQWRKYVARKNKEDEMRHRQVEYEASKPDKSASLSSGWLCLMGSQDKIWLNTERTIIGRDPKQCQLKIDGDGSISRMHAVITNKDNQYYLEDLGSRNGTFVQSKRLEPHQRVLLTEGVRLRFGNTQYVFHKIELNRTVSIHGIRR